ncbi:hypothetical protein C8R43DRAFT_1137903 [Mycena crocata]|nr:hypothetical protein C8R43DRAFT_1137903 [Mycena crocata]
MSDSDSAPECLCAAALTTDQRKRYVRLNQISLRFRAIHNERWDLEKEAHRITKRQEALNRERYALTRERAALGVFDEHAFRLAPIRRIPVEILIEIFLSAAQECDVPQLGDGTATVLSQVSQHWRAVACDVPGLWASFEFHLCGIQTDPDAQLLELYLRRSGDASLSVHLNNSVQQRGHLNVLNCPQMALLAEHAHRLRLLRFIHPPGSEAFDYLQGKVFERLEVLEMSGIYRTPFGGFANAPRLHRVSFIQSHTSFNVLIPTYYIRTLHLGDGWMLSHGNLAGNYPNLTSLVCVPDFEEWRVPPETTFEKLENWTFGCRHGHPLSMGFIDSFTTPALRRLEMSLFERHSSGPKICALLTRSGCDLTELTIKESRAPNTITEKFIDALTLRPGKSARLPRLTSLHIDGSYILRDQCLIEMFESRNAPDVSPPLQTVELILRDRALAETVIDRFLAVAGVELSLFCLDVDKQIHRVVGGIDLPDIPSFGNDSTPADFLS